MLKVCLLLLPWMADPAVVDRKDQFFEPNLVTCSRPAVKVSQPATVTALSQMDISEDVVTTVLLRRWERAARNQADWTRSQREEFRRQIQNDFNEHSLAAAELVVGRINAEGLRDNYKWRIVEQTRQQICLEAIPRDYMEGLFYNSLRISLATKNSLPEQIVVVSRNQTRRVAWQSEVLLKDDLIQLVRFESDVPPAPTTVIRTVDTRRE